MHPLLFPPSWTQIQAVPNFCTHFNPENVHKSQAIDLHTNWTHKKLHQSNHHADQDWYAVPAEYMCKISPLATTCLMCTPVGAVYFYSLNGQNVHRSRRLHGTSHLHSHYINLLCKLSLWLNRAFWDQLTVYYQQMHLMLTLFNLKCLKY
jgi:hypothetical protein